ncbi:MAG: long-chain fatty acid--CoA ligase [Firmicutes bacterium]|nr:long-chain fatty acid--CoA ligase [Bacillota bacterium]
MSKFWLKSYEPTVPHTIDYPKISLYEMFKQTAERFPSNPATSFMGREFTYRELLALIDSFAAALEALGVKKGDRVAIHLPNSTQFPIAFFGALSIGAIVVPCNPMYVARELAYQLKDSGAETIVTMTRFYDLVKEIQPQTELKNLIVTNIKDYFPGMLRFLYTVAKEKKEGDRVTLAAEDYSFSNLMKAHAGKKPRPVKVDPEDRALYMYTGGSTGVSKGAVLQHRNLLANALQVKSWCSDLEEGKETFLAVLPFFHSYGMTTVMNLPLFSGNKIVMLPRFVLADVLKTIDKEKPTLFPGVPTMYVAINNAPGLDKHDVKSVRVCISGAAPLPVEVQKQFERNTGGKLVEGYGLSEASPVTHANPIYGKSIIGSIGLPLPDTEVKIVDIDTGTEDLPIGSVGEMCVRGPQVMECYHNMPDETKNSLRDGWLYTGDIGKLDEEGYTYIVDRKKDMVIAGGYNIYPRDIEEVLFTHPKIIEAAVAGVMDPYRGETLKAYVVLKEGESLTEKEVIEFCKDNLAAYKVPKLVEFREELPKTMVGKVLRRVLREEEEKKAQQADQ